MKVYNHVCNPRVIFVTLIAACIAALVLSFASWNKARSFSYNSQVARDLDLKYSIDSCGTRKDTFFVKGWMFDSTYPHEGSLIITVNTSGKEFILPLFTFARGDVSQIFARTDDFDKVGFNASISKKLIEYNESAEFNFYIRDNGGKVTKVLSYECKQ
ncbi:hypothetical protein [Pantoea cypripedii]|uniref:Uncharacterized protein n=1 Tax=Pantoea cypripedii TaxID=55209 RepID=A0A6B9GAR6_PANCY|nr:hypothetical protein [Pantoea cypripedii]QGY29755.1 hypothetical protein CUN67_12775 [Pantoea cypripedii]